jgi:hypothetical protein
VSLCVCPYLCWFSFSVCVRVRGASFTSWAGCLTPWPSTKANHVMGRTNFHKRASFLQGSTTPADDTDCAVEGTKRAVKEAGGWIWTGTARAPSKAIYGSDHEGLRPSSEYLISPIYLSIYPFTPGKLFPPRPPASSSTR